jgi:hypothetical protein
LYVEPSVESHRGVFGFVRKTFTPRDFVNSQTPYYSVQEKEIKIMAQPTIKELQDEISDLQATLDQVGDLIDDSLDPSLSREAVIEKVQEIDGILGEDEDEDEDEDDDEL